MIVFLILFGAPFVLGALAAAAAFAVLRRRGLLEVK